MTMNIAVLGAGSWGATLATLLAEKNHAVTLWEFNPEQAKELSYWRTLKFFQQLTIPKSITITSDLKAAVEGKDLILFVVPSHTLRGVASALNATGVDYSRAIIVSATKGIENGSLKRMSEIIAEEMPKSAGHIAALSGPTHAEEVAQRIPTTITVASPNATAADTCQEAFATPYFRVYTNTDIIGVETGAALKNVFAIAAGICDGLGMGDNTKAALITRGLRELAKLGIQLGGKPSTFFGLTGLGDLIVTCCSKHSRNRDIGEKIGKGKSLSQAETEMLMVAEGVRTTASAYALGQKYGLELPIIEQMYKVLYENKPAREAVTELMTRDPKSELDLTVNCL